MTRKTGNLIDELYEYTAEELRLLQIMQKCRKEKNLEDLLICLDLLEVHYAKARPYRFRMRMLSEIMGGPKISLEN